MNRDNRYFRLALQPGGVVRRREGRRWSDNEQISDLAANERAPERVPFITRARRFRTRAPRVETPQLTHAYSPTTQLQTVMAAFGVGGYVLVCLYFVFGSAVTKIKLEQKQAEGIAEARGGRRGVGSVWGSGIAGIACACLALAGVGPGENLWRLGFAASFCSKLSDTTASEVGKAYGKTTYMSTPLSAACPGGRRARCRWRGRSRGSARAWGSAGVAAGGGPGGSDRAVDRDVSRVHRDHGGVVARRDDAGRGRVRVADERRRQRGSDHARGGGGGGAGRGGGVTKPKT